MNEWIVPLAAPRLLDDEIEQLAAGYRSGWWTIGPRAERLEADLCGYTGAEHAVAVSSCTAALHLACLALELGPGDSVVLPAITFAAAANMVAATGARPVFAEIKSVTEPWLDPAAVEAALAGGSRGVINLAYGGHPGEVEQIARVATERGAPLVEDAAHAAGSWAGGRHLGTIGGAGALSFSASKNLAVGEGGALLCRDAEAAARARSLRWQGISSSTARRHSDPVGDYAVERPGFNYRFDDPRAGVVSARLRRLDRDNARRAELAAAYRNALAGEERLVPTAPPPAGERASHCIFTAVVAEGVERDALRRELAERGVQTSVHFPPLHVSPAYADASPVRLPVSEDYGRRSVTLPLFPEMEQRQLDLVVEAVRSALPRCERRSAA